MKNVNAVYLLMLLVGCVLGMFFLSLLPMMLFSNNAVYLIGTVMFFGWPVFEFMFLTDMIWNKSIKKLKGTFHEHSFNPTSTFESNSTMLFFDGEKGNIGAIARYNPFELQILNAKDIENARTDKGAGIMGGTRQVCFRFDYKGKKCKIPTFTSNVTYSLKSEEVLTAISKADLHVEMINKAKNEAIAQRA